MTHEEAVGTVAGGRASHFSPAVVNQCQAGEVKFQAIAQAFSGQPDGTSQQMAPSGKKPGRAGGHLWSLLAQSVQFKLSRSLPTGKTYRSK